MAVNTHMIPLTVTRLQTLSQKTTGLSGATRISPVYFETRFGIHTFGVRFPIDVVILSTDSRVVKFHESLRPRRFFFWKPIYSRVLELPEGTIRLKKIRVGSEISLQYITD